MPRSHCRIGAPGVSAIGEGLCGRVSSVLQYVPTTVIGHFMKSLRVAALMAVLGFGQFIPGIAVASSPPVELPIQSAEELQRYLALSAANDSPLNALPPGARQRFLGELQIDDQGIGGFSYADLQDTLTNEQIEQLLRLFGLEAHAHMASGLPTPRVPRDFISGFEQRFDAFHDAVRQQDAADTEQTRRLYGQLLGGTDPVSLAQSLDHYDRALLYRATIQALRHAPSIELAEQGRALLAMQHRQGDALPRHVHDLFHTFVEVRQFEFADQLRSTYPDAGLAPLPARTFAGEPGRNSMLQVSPDRSTLSRNAIDLDKGLHIVVVAGCHFARDAALAVSADPALDSLFHRHATWLAPSGESFDGVAEWNRELPTQPINIAWSERDWPEIESWSMPTFHVFRDGELVTQWTGWPRDTGLATLHRQLQAAGVEY